jgi:IS5 family transposase
LPPFGFRQERRRHHPEDEEQPDDRSDRLVFRHEGAFWGRQPQQLIHAVVATPPNVADSTVLPQLLHGKETRLWGDQAYRGQRAVMRQHAPKAQDFINRRYRQRGVVNESERAKNRTKSKVRAKVEHPIGVIKRVFGFVKVRYRGLKKNTHCLVVTCALVNLFMARRHLLRCYGA